MKKPFLLRIPKETLAELEKEAKRLGVSTTALINQILCKYADRLKPN